MTWEDYHVDPDALIARDLDKPMFVANNILSLASAAEWRTSAVLSSGTDATISGFPTRLSYDGRGTLLTRGLSTGSSTIALLYTLPFTASSRFDTIAIINHNFASIGNLTNVYVEISDGTDFGAGSRVCRVADFDDFSVDRLVSTNLYVTNTSYVISGYDRAFGTTAAATLYLRVRLVGSGNLGASPEIGEVFAGTRSQLPVKADIPFNKDPVRSEVIDFVSESGERTRHTMYKGKSDRDLIFTGGGGEIGNCEVEASLRQWFEDCAYGTKSSLYIEDPATAPQKAILVLPDPAELRIDYVGPFENQCAVFLSELPPFVATET